MSNQLRILVALPRPIVTLLVEENGDVVSVARWERATGASAVPPLRETPKLDAVTGALRDRPVRLIVLRQATVEALQDALRDPPHVFVLDTHGDEDGTLLFEGPCGETNPLPAAELGDLLARRGVLLAVLSACLSKVGAEAVCQTGVPLAVGMAESIYEDTAAAYLAAFLGALARLCTRFGRRPDEAKLPCLLTTDDADVQPLVADLSAAFEDATPPLPHPKPDVPLSRLFGRELDQVLAQRFLLQEDGRLITLTGMGGIGKTALARAVARWAWQRNLFPGGVHFASLENLTAQETVAGRLMGQLGLTPREKETPEDAGLTPSKKETPEDALTAALSRAPALLVADNCETAGLGSGLEVLTNLRRRCPRLRVLATGLHKLDLDNETVYELPLLALNDAVQMFLDRAGRTEREDERSIIETICQKLDRVPLYIELVASHQATPAEILEGLNDTVRAHCLTAADRPDLPERQRSMLLSFYYTWERLSADGQKTWAVFAAVFASGAEAAALRAVAANEWDTDAGLEELTAWHVLQRQEAAGRSRYTMLPTTADFGRDRAGEAETGLDLPALRRRHAEYYLAYAQQHRSEFELLHAALDNIRRGWAHVVAADTRDEEMVRDYNWAVQDYLRIREHWDELMQWLTECSRACEALEDQKGLATTYTTTSVSFMMCGGTVMRPWSGTKRAWLSSRSWAIWLGCPPSTTTSVSFMMCGGTVMRPWSGTKRSWRLPKS